MPNNVEISWKKIGRNPIKLKDADALRFLKGDGEGLLLMSPDDSVKFRGNGIDILKKFQEDNLSIGLNYPSCNTVYIAVKPGWSDVSGPRKKKEVIGFAQKIAQKGVKTAIDVGTGGVSLIADADEYLEAAESLLNALAKVKTKGFADWVFGDPYNKDYTFKIAIYEKPQDISKWAKLGGYVTFVVGNESVSLKEQEHNLRICLQKVHRNYGVKTGFTAVVDPDEDLDKYLDELEANKNKLTKLLEQIESAKAEAKQKAADGAMAATGNMKRKWQLFKWKNEENLLSSIHQDAEESDDDNIDYGT
ncbi:MAG: hypothetical protein ACJAS1_004123 [Oleiphilaceae bacterium]|jgi:hypothetical protein